MDTTKPLRADARRNREKIVTAAIEAFTTAGTEAQMDDIARRAGVGIGTVYRNFPTKDALIEAIVAAHMEENAALAREHLEGGAGAWDCFADFIRAAGSKDQALADVVSSQPAETFTDALETTGLRAIVATMIERAQAEGTMRADATVDDVPIVMCGMAMTLLRLGPDAGRRYIELMLDGLRAPQPSPST